MQRKQRNLHDLLRDELLLADSHAHGLLADAGVGARVHEKIGAARFGGVRLGKAPAPAVRVDAQRHLLADDGTLRRRDGAQERDRIGSLLDAVLFRDGRELFGRRPVGETGAGGTATCRRTDRTKKDRSAAVPSARSVPCGTTSIVSTALRARRPPPTSTVAGPTRIMPTRRGISVQVAEMPMLCVMRPLLILTCVCVPTLGPRTSTPGGAGRSGSCGVV